MATTLPSHPLSHDRIWIDGCFDFTHHGHAGAMLQAKQLGRYLCVGIHSDAEITSNKGPTVMSLAERVLAVSACRWADLAVPNAPYVTDPTWMDAYGCHYVVHGDDVTTDADGEDCYRIVKAAGRFRIVARTPGISTTDLVGRMLLCTKTHHLPAGAGLPAEEMDRVRAYASDEFGVRGLGPPVFGFPGNEMVSGRMPSPGQKVVYVDGGFDLFTPGHVEFLRRVYAEYEDPYIVAGVHDDATINRHKGLNYPIMNMLERSLCVLQCRYVHAVFVGAPYVPDLEAVEKIWGTVEAVWHGPTNFMEGDEDTYEECKKRGIYKEVKEHQWSEVNAGEIVQRILRQREVYEERQRKKGVKAGREVEMNN